VTTASEERPGGQWWVPEALTLSRLRSEVQDCRGCELYQDATHGVMGSGPETADLMVIGEQPGAKEDEEGRPFVGPAGKLLDEALTEAGIDPASVFRTNMVKHFRFSGHRGKQRIHKSPGRVHVTACGPWLVAEMALVRPVGVVLLGATAGKALFGTAFRVGESRGKLHDWPGNVGDRAVTDFEPDWVLPTAHPAAVLRSRRRDDDFKLLVEDLRVAAGAL
jgi:uracil-DNA glycosylase